MDGDVPLLAVLIDGDNTSPEWSEAIFEEVSTLGEASVETKAKLLDLQIQMLPADSSRTGSQ